MEIGLYEQLINKVISDRLVNLDRQTYYIDERHLDKEEAATYLTRYITPIIKYALNSVDGNDSVIKQIELANKIIIKLRDALGDNDLDDNLIESSAKLLTGVFSKIDNPYLNIGKRISEITPQTRLSYCELFTGNNTGISLDGELKKEILSSNSISILVSFIKWSGIVILKDALEEFTNNGGNLKVITTTYMGATDLKSVLFLASLKNTEIKISYNQNQERLHAKAYLFTRDTSFNTGYIGSSNLSRSALTKGLEWNIKVTSKEIPQIIEKFQKTFETYWEDDDFEIFNINTDIDKVQKSLNSNKSINIGSAHFLYDLHPHPYQKEILERLISERTIHHRFKNLIVAATGTGKTMISAFDYKDFKLHNNKSNLLFIAHRKEILEQAIYTFRHVLKDNNLGELWVDGMKPENLTVVFASIQTLTNQINDLSLSKHFYDYVIIDEVHHIAAKSYRPILSHFEPKVLLGLTATPERMDNEDILLDFDNVVAAEIRLPEALNRKLLCPFQYFGITDSINLSQISWKMGKYDKAELEEVYMDNNRRIIEILNNLDKYLTDPHDTIALGYCVSMKHAEYMANEFNARGYKSDYLTSKNSNNRTLLRQKLMGKEINYLFVVDIFNEGVDIPEIDTILFLRPTESLTVFLQQLGRGLRISQGKEFLTVLDFVGNSRPEYDFETKFRSLIGKSNLSTLKEIENDFPHIPLGCSIILEPKAKEIILDNIRIATSPRREKIIQKINQFKNQTSLNLTLKNFCEFTHYTLEQIYSRGCWKRLCAEAKVISDFSNALEEPIHKAIKLKWLVSNSYTYFQFIQELAKNNFIIDFETLPASQKTMCLMLHYDIWGENKEFDHLSESINAIGQNVILNQEIAELMEILIDKVDILEKPLAAPFEIPITLHGRYTRDQIFAAFGAHSFEKKSNNREGVHVIESLNAEILFVTLNKSPNDYSPSTLYDDYAISDKIFHWQSQNPSRPDKGKGLSYVKQSQNGKQIFLFVREQNDTIYGSTMGYVSLGQVEYISHSGSKPMNIKWRLLEPMPAFLWKDSVKMGVG